jgi:regulator of protease activity HflC (stomatin/prohibitin superfamily)
MIVSILIFVLALIFGVIFILGGAASVKNASYNDSAAKNAGSKKIITGGAIIVIGLISAFVQPFSLEKIDAGNKGLRVSLVGSSRGVSGYKYESGWVFYNSWTEQILEFPVYQQHIEYDNQSVILRGGFSATIKPTFNYSLKQDAIGDMFVNLRRPISEIEQNWLKNAIIGAVNDEANKWEVDSIFNHRQAFEAAIVSECNVRLSKWFNVSQLRTNITPPEELQESIISKTKAIQQAEASKQQAIAAKADGERKVAVAKADSAEQVINASAAAKVIKLKQQELTPMYIEYIKAQAWDGVLPTTVAGGAGTFLNIKK